MTSPKSPWPTRPAESSRPSSNTPVYHAFHVKDEYWTKIGAAWPTKSAGGFSVVLDVLPPDGRFFLMEPKTSKATLPSL